MSPTWANGAWTEEREAAAWARHEAATKGPWMTGEHVGEPAALCAESDPETSLLGADREGMAIFCSARRTESVVNAAFTAHAREDLPDAIAEIRRLRGELAAMETVGFATERDNYRLIDDLEKAHAIAAAWRSIMSATAALVLARNPAEVAVARATIATASDDLRALGVDVEAP